MIATSWARPRRLHDDAHSLQAIRPEHWLAEYTTDLLDLLNVLTLLVEQEPEQARLLEEVCAGELISEADLRIAGAIGSAAITVDGAGAPDSKQTQLF